MWSLSTRQRWAGPPSFSAAPGRSHRTQIPRSATAPGTALGTTPHGSPPGSARSPPRPSSPRAQGATTLDQPQTTAPPDPSGNQGGRSPCVHGRRRRPVIVALPRQGRETRDRVREAGSRRGTRLRKRQEGVADTRALLASPVATVSKMSSRKRQEPRLPDQPRTTAPPYPPRNQGRHPPQRPLLSFMGETTRASMTAPPSL
jgi:hypothetical protein